VLALREKQMQEGKKVPEVVVIDARKMPSASKRFAISEPMKSTRLAQQVAFAAQSGTIRLARRQPQARSDSRRGK
jgi:hypothetical protein